MPVPQPFPVVSQVLPGATDPIRLTGWQRTGVDAIWLLIAGCLLILFALSVPEFFTYLRDTCMDAPCAWATQSIPSRASLAALGISPSAYAFYLTALTVAVTAVYVIVAGLMFWRRSDEPVALLGGATLLTWGLFMMPYSVGALVERHPAWQPVSAGLSGLAMAAFTLFFLVFPDGRFVPRWTVGLGVAFSGFWVLRFLAPGSWLDQTTWPLALQVPVVLAWPGSLLGVQIYRYRRVSGPASRQQTKWVIFGLASAFGAFLMVVSLPAVIAPAHAWSVAQHLILATASPLTMLLIPLTFGVAILRHHLWDIDLVINRSLVYSTLSVCVAGLYLMVVGVLSRLLAVNRGWAVVIVATGLAAVAALPLRTWLQRSVNRVMYGDRDDAAAVILRLERRLSASLVTDSVLAVIVQTVKEALKLSYAAVALKYDAGFVVAEEVGQSAGATENLPLTYQGQVLGELRLGPRVRGEALTPPDYHLLRGLARHAGAAIHAVRLTTDLQRSREQLVLTREEERRRLRRDLHDGLGAALAGIHLQAGQLLQLIRRDPGEAEALVVELRGYIAAAVDDIRRVAYDLRPPALDEFGLVGAIRLRASQLSAHSGGLAPGSPVQVIVRAPEPFPALPAALEVATYRIVLEALTNVIRHAQATVCEIGLVVQAGSLQLTIGDDGRGLDDQPGQGIGMEVMKERAAELGGRHAVEALIGGGTLVRVWLPLPREILG